MFEKNEKGITRFAREFRILGIKCFWLGVLVKSLQEKRLLELLLPGLDLVWCKLFPFKTPDQPTAVQNYEEVFTQFTRPNDAVFVSRAQAIWSDPTLRIACEYGQPGARILVETDTMATIYAPYRDEMIWHLHAIAHLGDNIFLISTGDTKKTLDMFRITAFECTKMRRVAHRLTGYTAMVVQNGKCWVGSDFSERANFIALWGKRKKFFLPRDSLREYVLHLEFIEADKLLVVTRRLGTSKGHALVFCTVDGAFVASNVINTNERTRHETISA